MTDPKDRLISDITAELDAESWDTDDVDCGQ